ncbi:MAG: hypothetical protein J1F27_07860, partial [Prevotellaceae bacterium]|nr:hypothetical protein [Prevotellaceae bacterium]
GTIGATGQGLREDSIFAETEIEDSLSSFAIKKPVEKPKKLLKQCLRQLKEDLKQNHSRRQYLFRTINYHTYPPNTGYRIYTVENDDGIHLFNTSDPDLTGEWGAFNAEELSLLDKNRITNWWFGRRQYDEWNFKHLHYKSGRYDHIDRDGVAYRYASARQRGTLIPLNSGEGVTYSYASGWSRFSDIYNDLTRFYDIKAYSISDDSVEGVYCIDLVQKKIKARRVEIDCSEPSHSIRLCFDMKSLRLIQEKGGLITRKGIRTYYKRDYGVENGSPVLTHFQLIEVAGQKIQFRHFVQLMEDK